MKKYFEYLFNKGGGETLSGDEQDALALIELDEAPGTRDREEQGEAGSGYRPNWMVIWRPLRKAEAGLAALEKLPKATTPAGSRPGDGSRTDRGWLRD